MADPHFFTSLYPSSITPHIYNVKNPNWLVCPVGNTDFA